MEEKDYCIIVRTGTSTIVWGPACYDDAIKFGMNLLAGGNSVEMIPMHPITMEDD